MTDKLDELFPIGNAMRKTILEVLESNKEWTQGEIVESLQKNIMKSDDKENEV